MRRTFTYPPQGPLGGSDGSVTWRVWAPRATDVSLVTWPEGQRGETRMTPIERGYFISRQSRVEEGLRYSYRLDGDRELPDPASRWQPEGVHRPSAVFFPDDFSWSDAPWQGIDRDDLVLYELHIGTFTPEGTLDAAVERLDALKSLGMTAVELMPVAQFAGSRNWGYDGVHPYAVQNSYGGPRALQRFVDAAHRVGLAVLLDVVYNHFGPEGNYLSEFGPYTTRRYSTPWGEAVNFDGPDSDAVRQFVVDNARAWIRDFHLDGLRLDAVHSIYDFSPRHILADLKSGVEHEAATAGRTVHVIAESDLNDVRLIRPQHRGGHGLDAVWSDDFHHAVHALLTGQRDGYYADFGSPADLAKAFADVFVYDGRYSAFRRRRHGTRVGKLDRTRFVVCIQNHDQVGNRFLGDRLDRLVSPAARRLAAGLLMISPCVPLLFMGEEYGERRPFPFFCSFSDPALVEAVRQGRREEFASLAFEWGTEVPDPQAPEIFASAKLVWNWPEGSAEFQSRQLYQDLLAARRRWLALVDRRHVHVRLVNETGKTYREEAGPALLVVDRGVDGGLRAVANLSDAELSLAALEIEERTLLLSTENACYGGGRRAEGDSAATVPDRILPHELLLLGKGGQS